MADRFSTRYGDLLSGSYDCVDRIVLNGYMSLCHSPGGFRVWWRRLHGGSDEELDNVHLMRMAGRFSRRVRAWGKANGVPVTDCPKGERKHRIAEEYLATHAVGTGVFMVLVAKAKAPVWEVQRSKAGVICNLAKKKAFVNHYSFHIMDPTWGHVVIKISGHAPFGAQIILNGHEYVALAAQAAGVAFTKEGNCFTEVVDPTDLAQVADTLSAEPAIGRLSQVCDRWIYSACLCFGLTLEEQEVSRFGYGYSIYQVEYSRNLVFHLGGQMERVFNTVVDRSRSRLDVASLRTLFGTKQRPRIKGRGDLSARVGTVIETPRHDLSIFKVHFGLLTLKAYTKGEHVLRFEAIVHNTRALGVGRVLERFPEIVCRLGAMVQRFCDALDCVDVGFIPDGLLDELPLASQIGATKVGGVDLNKPRMRNVLGALLALAAAPEGFTVADLAARVRKMTGQGDGDYSIRQAAYDLRKLRGKGLVAKPGRTRRYQVPLPAVRTITALLILRDHVIAPILAGVRSPRRGRKPAHWTAVDRDYESLRVGMETLLGDLGIVTEAAAAA
jgi:DNA-binding transcriptional ArsR family regulator